jgi:4,5-dihydroxyphthalate decarboxylase
MVVTTVPLALGCSAYDRTAALLDGTVQVEGVDLRTTAVLPHELFARVLARGEFDAAEMSLSNLMTLVARGDDRFVGIPVFPGRVLRHGYIFVNASSGVQAPRDLVGRRVGVVEYSQTAAVWTRGFLEHEYGVRPGDVHWRIGGVDKPGEIRRISVDLPGDVDIQPIREDQCLGDMLADGEIDAYLGAALPAVFKRGHPNVRRMFPNFPEVEADYYRRTGIVPIMHTVVLRRAIYDRYPWIAASLFDAFARAKQASYVSMEETGVPRVSLVWLQRYIEAERAFFGGDPFPYGLEANRPTIEALARYVHEQGLSERLVSAEEPFAAETLSLR